MASFTHTLVNSATSTSDLIISDATQVPLAYRKILMDIMSMFCDSQLAVSAAFSTIINSAPNIHQRVNVARIIMEKAENAESILSVMATLDACDEQYLHRLNSSGHYNWQATVARNTDIQLAKSLAHDKRAITLHYPVENWTDAMMMYVLIEKAAYIIVSQVAKIFYQPLARIACMVLTAARRRTCLSHEELLRLCKAATHSDEREMILNSFQYWLPRVQAAFDIDHMPYFEQLRAMGFVYNTNSEMLADFDQRAKVLLQSLMLVCRL